mmetsp:Transcript_18680/g.29898  ORF Transcript_18680/g.29898 Transcript_18680/m.29898 type:complete len:217 (+) Transcript_18680:343-993(+)
MDIVQQIWGLRTREGRRATFWYCIRVSCRGWPALLTNGISRTYVLNYTPEFAFHFPPAPSPWSTERSTPAAVRSHARASWLHPRPPRDGRTSLIGASTSPKSERWTPPMTASSSAESSTHASSMRALPYISDVALKAIMSSPTSALKSASSAALASATRLSVQRSPSRRCVMASLTPRSSAAVSGACSSAASSASPAPPSPPLATISLSFLSTPAT